MNKTKTRVMITAFLDIEHTGEIDELIEKEMEELQSRGWDVSIEEVEDL